jgi:lipopolysaccharide export LptBFGC system permease protein LptF
VSEEGRNKQKLSRAFWQGAGMITLLAAGSFLSLASGSYKNHATFEPVHPLAAFAVTAVFAAAAFAWLWRWERRRQRDQATPVETPAD